MLKALGGFALGSVGAVTYKGTWDADTNNPDLVNDTPDQGDYYVVNVAGNTDLDGITDWEIGDWAIFNGTVWQKVDNTDSVNSVNGQVGTVVLNAANVGAVANTTFVNATGLLTGGGQLTGNVAIDLTNVPVANVPGAVANTTFINATGLLSGGGQLTGNVSIDLTNVPIANVSNGVSDSIEIIASTGLTGGGNLAANVTIALANTAVIADTYGGGSNAAQITVDAQGRITSAANVAVPQGTVTNVATGVGLTGGPITSTGTIDLANTAVIAGVYGDATNVATLTIDAQGRITNAANVAISGVGSNTVVTNIQLVVGSAIDWTNASAAVIAWQNNSLANIDWTGLFYNVTANDATLLIDCTLGGINVVLPAAASVTGQQYKIKKVDTTANVATISTTSSETIDNSLTANLSNAYASTTVQSDGSNWWVTAEVV